MQQQQARSMVPDIPGHLLRIDGPPEESQKLGHLREHVSNLCGLSHSRWVDIQGAERKEATFSWINSISGNKGKGERKTGVRCFSLSSSLRRSIFNYHLTCSLYLIIELNLRFPGAQPVSFDRYSIPLLQSEEWVQSKRKLPSYPQSHDRPLMLDLSFLIYQWNLNSNFHFEFPLVSATGYARNQMVRESWSSSWSIKWLRFKRSSSLIERTIIVKLTIYASLIMRRRRWGIIPCWMGSWFWIEILGLVQWVLGSSDLGKGRFAMDEVESNR